MGAKWAEKPIESLASVAGEWNGSGANKRGKTFTIKLIFKEDGSLDYSVIMPPKGTKNEQREPGTVRVNGGKLKYENRKGNHLWTVTLYEDKKGKRMLKAKRDDGNNWKVKEKK
jgi:hypothetical protein